MPWRWHADDHRCSSRARTTLAHPDVAVVTSWAEIALSRERRCSEQRCSLQWATRRRHSRAEFARDAEERELLSRGEAASPAPGNGDFRPDALTADLALYHLQTHPTRFLFVGLGEPDEYGHQGNYAGYLDALRRADSRIAEIDADARNGLAAAHGTGTKAAVHHGGSRAAPTPSTSTARSSQSQLGCGSWHPVPRCEPAVFWLLRANGASRT